MSIVVSSTAKLPKVRVPRSWRKDRIEPTHFIYNGVIERGGKGSGKGIPEIPQFGAGWRCVQLEKEGHKWAHVVETGSGTRAKVELDLWKKMARHGKALQPMRPQTQDAS